MHIRQFAENIIRQKHLGVFITIVIGILLVSSMAIKPGSAAPSTNGLLAHWSLDQINGSTVNDDSGNGLNGTLNGSPDVVAGSVGNAFKFGSSDEVAIGNIPQINGAQQVTLAAWLKRDATNARVLVGKQSYGHDVAVEYWDDGRLYFQLSNGQDTSGSIYLNDTQWHHVVMVYDGTLTGNQNRLKGYVDGVEAALSYSGTVASTTTTNTTQFNIGTLGGDFSNGQIDDVWLYNRALSFAEVQELHLIDADTEAPTTPTGLSASAASQTQVDLVWSPATDNVAVAGYRVYRDGIEVGTTAGTSHQDSGLSASTQYNYTVRAYDAANNQSAASATATVTTPDPVPAPTVSLSADPQSVATGGQTVLIWSSTDADSCAASAGWSGTKATSGTQTITDIQTGASYTLTCDGDGGQAAQTVSVTVLPQCDDGIDNDGDGFVDTTDPGCSSATDNDETDAPADTQVPTVSITTPENDAVIDGTVTLSATASDNVGVDRVEFAVSGTPVGNPDTTSPYSVSFDTTTVTDGAYVLRATAYDAAGNSTFAETHVTVQNTPPADTQAPTVSLSSPAPNATLSGNIIVAASASDNVAVAGVTFYADGAPISNEITQSPYSFSWSTTSVANGTVSLTAVARDAAGNTTTSAAVSVTIDNQQPTGQRFITDVSSNGRYFVDQNGQPIIVRGDSPWEIMTQLSPQETELYLDNRESYGTNALILSLIGSEGSGYTANGATYDGILPFHNRDFSTPNEAYWERMDTYLGMMRDRGMTAMLYLIDGWNLYESQNVFNQRSTSECAEYGAFVGERYSAYPNIIWMFGGDYFPQTNEPELGASTDHCMNAALQAIRDTGDTRLTSIQLGYEKSLSTDNPYWEPRVDWNFDYTYYATYKAVYDGWNKTRNGANLPSLFSEGAYEGSPVGDGGPASVIRRTALWALTSGSPGDITGQEGVWNFLSNWQNKLDTTTATQLMRIRDRFESLEWWKLIPDQTNEFVTAGHGTRVTTDAAVYPLQNNYVTASLSPDGSLAAIYIPSSRTITLNTSKLATGYGAYWVNPANATLTQTATIDGNGQVTTPSGTHSDGHSDWLLIITSSGQLPVPDTQAPIVSVTNPLAGATVSDTISLNATADDDTGIDRVIFTINGIQVGNSDTAAPYGINFDTTTLINGSHILRATAYDTSGNAAYDEVTFTVSNAQPSDTEAPAVSISAPTGGASVSGTINISATASDNVGVANVTFYIDGAQIATADTTSPYGVSWNTTSVANGTYSLTAVASDAAGNSTTSAAVSITVNNTQPEPPTGLLAAYGFNSTADPLVDASGNNNTASCPTANCPVYSATGGHNGTGAYDFAGTGNWIALPNESQFDFTTQFTVSFWMKSGAFGRSWESFVTKGDSSWGVSRYGDSRFATFTTFSPGANDIGGSTIVDNDAWHHIAVVYDGSTKKLYVDGVLDASLSFTNSVSTNNVEVRLGYNEEYTVADYGGLLDDVRIYNTVLTQAQVQSDMNTPIN